MTPEQVLSHASRVLTREQREFYFENGWLLLEKIVPDAWLERLRAAAAEIAEGTRAMVQSSPAIELLPDHTADRPRLWLVSSPEDLQPAFWKFASESILTDIVCDLLGPGVRYRYAALPVKNAGPVEPWHQDLAYDPHDGTGLLAGIHLYDCGPKQARLMLIPGSHRGELFSHRNEHDEFIGELNQQEMQRVDVDAAIELRAPAGSIELLDYRTLHQDRYGAEEDGGPFLYVTYAAADAIPIGPVHYPPVLSDKLGTRLG
ncbi:MAG: phytanoyl-CoA dioxygenase family protein [Myxococcales bacterium]|nr:phytanoyl-CoA dioxygenase family protein [Myxococcales bacterium]